MSRMAIGPGTRVGLDEVMALLGEGAWAKYIGRAARWEGHTLVIEATNFTDDSNWNAQGCCDTGPARG